MLFKSAFLSTVLAGVALAAPTSSVKSDLHKRAEWQANKCEAHIYIDSSNSIEEINPTLKYDINIIATDGNRIGGWAGTNPDEIKIMTTTGFEFWVDGGIYNAGTSRAVDDLTLSYNRQIWNSQDCYRFILKSARPSNDMRHQYDWWCQFDC